MNRSTIKFYLLISLEFICWVPLYIRQLYLKRMSGACQKQFRIRKKVQQDCVHICIHEWGGYQSERNKKLKDGKVFRCGLAPAIRQLYPYHSAAKAQILVTISDSYLYRDSAILEKYKVDVLHVSNEGYDFSGYSAFYEKIKNYPNTYIILCNSSVNAIQEDFLDSYVSYMEANPDVGLLGVSYSTKMTQTLVRNNFTPHIQSFFLMTTIQVLSEVVSFNKGFPGANITHKLLLIREGEIRLSEIIKKLGYNLAVVNPIDKKTFKFSDYRSWTFPKGDIRLFIDEPNKINTIR